MRFWCKVLVAASLVGSVGGVQAQETKQQNGKKAPPATVQEATADATETKPLFLRIDKEGKEPRALQVAIAKYEIVSGPFQGATVDLIGAVHVGTKQYYSDLNQRFRNYDSVLYELVADPEVNKPNQRAEGGFNPISGLQTGMKEALELSFQLDEVDYSPSNFVHADMSPGEFGEDMKKRKDGFLGMFARMMGAGLAVQASKKGQQQQADMMAAMISKDPIRLRRVMAEQFESMEGQMAGLADKDGKSTLLTERNRKAFEVLQSELENGKRKLSVFYGAAHLNDMHDRLLRDFHAKPVSTEWVDAWPLR
ncbi:TraB family protein [Pirellula sp. SH-Sr6A]|uniref:TraB/GumN family protein n=1 Tax=Pirellula sp. SH-Sr6A TaxID=1632865 RepID=UPI00078DD3B1|nr:TraB/GumN family protein [Pirellula sp. SH-Sr6A]AMV33351.1 TraB family protein [Pirellula sp. SH-Sr6A]